MTDKLPEKMSGLLSNEQLTKHRTNIMIEVEAIDEPRRKPNEGMIYNRIQEARKRRLAALPKPNIEHYVLKKNPDSEQRSKLSKELLGNIKTFGGEH